VRQPSEHLKHIFRLKKGVKGFNRAIRMAENPLPCLVDGEVANEVEGIDVYTFRRNCNDCTRRRRRCSGTRPRCSRCEKAGVPCLYALDKARTAPWNQPSNKQNKVSFELYATLPVKSESEESPRPSRAKKPQKGPVIRAAQVVQATQESSHQGTRTTRTTQSTHHSTQSTNPSTQSTTLNTSTVVPNMFHPEFIQMSPPQPAMPHMLSHLTVQAADAFYPMYPMVPYLFPGHPQGPFYDNVMGIIPNYATHADHSEVTQPSPSSTNALLDGGETVKFFSEAFMGKDLTLTSPELEKSVNANPYALLQHSHNQQLRDMSLSLHQKGVLIPPLGEDGMPISSENLNYRFINQFIDQIPSWWTLMPFFALPLKSVYGRLYQLFLQKATTFDSIKALKQPISKTSVTGFLNDVNVLIQLATQRVLREGLASPFNDVATIRSEMILLMFVAILLFRERDTGPNGPLAASYTNIFQYLRAVGMDGDHGLTNMNKWTDYDVVFSQRLWILWASSDALSAAMDYRPPWTSLETNMDLRAIFGVLSCSNDKCTSLHSLQNANELEFAQMWAKTHHPILALFVSSLSLVSYLGQVFNWRIRDVDGNSPLATTSSSALHAHNPSRRYFEALMNAWESPETRNGIKIFGLETCPFGVQTTSLAFARGGMLVGTLHPVVQSSLDMAKSLSAHHSTTAGFVLVSLKQLVWQYMVQFQHVHYKVMQNMAQIKLRGDVVGVGTDHVFQVWQYTMQALFGGILLQSRGLLLHTLVEGLKPEERKDYSPLTFLQGALNYGFVRFSVFLNIWQLIDTLECLRVARSFWRQSVQYRFIAVVMDPNPFDSTLLKSGYQAVLEIFRGDEVTRVPADMSDYAMVAEQLPNLLSSIAARLFGDGTLNADALDADLETAHVKSLTILTLLLRILEVMIEARGKVAGPTLDSCLAKILGLASNYKSIATLQGICEHYSRL
jgi:hypothetical protein